jgi:hypothetical protein
MTTKREAALAVLKISDCFLDVVKEAGPEGAPSGPMYAAAMTYGMSLEKYSMIMDFLVRSGRIKLSNNCYYYIG